MSMCRVFSCAVGRGCLLWPLCSLGKTLLALCSASFHIPRPNLPVTPGVSWLPTFAFQSPIIHLWTFCYMNLISSLKMLIKQNEVEKYSTTNSKTQVITKKIHILSIYTYSDVIDIQKVASCNYIWDFWKVLWILLRFYMWTPRHFNME